MFNVKLYTDFNLLFIAIFSFKIIYKNKPLFLILNFQQIMNGYFIKLINILISFRFFQDIFVIEEK
jgi:hypothetical protein